AAFFPSWRVEVVLTTHFLPSRVQAPSPKPPVASKAHDRMRLAAGSQPIRFVILPMGTFLSVVENVARRKFWLSVQAIASRSTPPSSASPVQVPIAHSSPRRCCWLLGGSRGAVRTLLRSHCPSFLTWTLVKRERAGGPPSGGNSSVVPSSTATSGVTNRKASLSIRSFVPLLSAKNSVKPFSMASRPFRC